ncbi:MAG: hypothetical protein ACLRTA_03675 [Clostridia bacterium]
MTRKTFSRVIEGLKALAARKRSETSAVTHRREGGFDGKKNEELTLDDLQNSTGSARSLGSTTC